MSQLCSNFAKENSRRLGSRKIDFPQPTAAVASFLNGTRTLTVWEQLLDRYAFCGINFALDDLGTGLFADFGLIEPCAGDVLTVGCWWC